MVVVSRVDYCRVLLQRGAKVVCTLTSNPATAIEKVKIVIDPNVRIEPYLQTGAVFCLDHVSQASISYHVADRRHKHSSGISEVCFYISRGAARGPSTEHPQDLQGRKGRVGVEGFDGVDGFEGTVGVDGAKAAEAMAAAAVTAAEEAKAAEEGNEAAETKAADVAMADEAAVESGESHPPPKRGRVGAAVAEHSANERNGHGQAADLPAASTAGPTAATRDSAAANVSYMEAADAAAPVQTGFSDGAYGYSSERTSSDILCRVCRFQI